MTGVFLKGGFNCRNPMTLIDPYFQCGSLRNTFSKSELNLCLVTDVYSVNLKRQEDSNAININLYFGFSDKLSVIIVKMCSK